ncbi:MAG: transposase [Thermoanaerobaculia bacterium]
MFARAHRLAEGLLACEGRSTVTGMIAASGCDQRDWSADYRVFSRGRFDERVLFDAVDEHLRAQLPAEVPLVLAVDDTKLRKSSLRIPGVSYQRDPMSPPFRHNLIPAQRFLQMSLSVPIGNDGPARAFPIRFQHVPPLPRPRRDASDEARTAYRAARRKYNLSTAAVHLLTGYHEHLAHAGNVSQLVVAAVDGGYTNGTVIRNLPPRTALVGRIRADAKLFHLPTAQPARGRRRRYGDVAPTPEQLRQDEATPWQSVRVWASGKLHDCQVKVAEPLLWKSAGADIPLRLIVIRPLGYRLRRTSKLLYRKPAYLICTNPQLDLEFIIQAYFRRWDIEVNHRDEKQLIGVGEAQVRNPNSVAHVPAFAVAVYAMLLLASALTYGFDATSPPITLPAWYAPAATTQPRITSGQILRAFRASTRHDRATGPQPNFTDFETRLALHLKCSKQDVSHEMAVAYALS